MVEDVGMRELRMTKVLTLRGDVPYFSLKVPEGKVG